MTKKRVVFIIFSAVVVNRASHTLPADYGEHQTSTVYHICGIKSASSFNLFSLSDLLKKGCLCRGKENPFIIPGVCGVGEINSGVQAGFIYILLCEPNTLTWGKENEWVVGGEEVRGFSEGGEAMAVGKRR